MQLGQMSYVKNSNNIKMICPQGNLLWYGWSFLLSSALNYNLHTFLFHLQIVSICVFFVPYEYKITINVELDITGYCMISNNNIVQLVPLMQWLLSLLYVLILLVHIKLGQST